MRNSKFLLTICLATLLTAFPAFGQQTDNNRTQDDPVEEAGRATREAGEEAAEEVGQAAEETGEAVQEAGEAAKEAGEKARDAGETAAQEAGQAADEAGRNAEMGESQSDRGDNAQVIRDAAEVVREMTQGADSKIPASVLKNAHAIAVVPNLVEGAAIVGGSFGEGVVVARTDDGNWGRTPAFIDLGGASAGLQLGAAETDMILVFSTKESLDHLLDGKFELGAEASVVAGPTGASADTSGSGDGPIYAYTRKEGAYAGAAIDGMVINIDDSANKEVYGSELSARALLTGQAGQAQASAIVQPLLDALSAAPSGRAE